MGCNMSRLEEDKNVHAKLLPFSGPLEDSKHQSHGPKETSSTGSPELADERKSVENSIKGQVVVAAAEKDLMKVPSNVVIKRSNANEDEFPGSPSFRIFITDADRLRNLDDNSLKVIEEEEPGCMVDKERTGENSFDTSTSSEDSFGKQQKKETWGRLKALTRASSRIYNCLAPKGCHVPVNASERSSTDDKPKHHPSPPPLPPTTTSSSPP